jgi:orotidine-5'-phosphate decarboxylase
MTFLEKLEACWRKNDSLLCVGLDPDMDKLPTHLKDGPAPYFEFNKAIIDATAGLVCAYKPNSAFYEARGAAGIEELGLTCEYLHDNYPQVPVILDFKRGDIGNTNEQYAKFAFDYLGVDAVTIQPYLGQEAVQAFLDYKDKGIIVLARTSNEDAGEFQDLEIEGKKLYLRVAENVVKHWNANNNCQLVVGATFPAEMAEIRKTVGDNMVFLVPGLGAQGGDPEGFVKAGVNSKGTGLIINSSRGILYAENGKEFAGVARAKAQLARNTINKYRR